MIRIGIGITVLVLLVWYVGLFAIMEHLATLDLRWVVPAVGAIVVATLISGFNRYILIGVGTGMSLSRFMPIFWLSWAAGLIIPGQIGDVATLGALMRRRGLHWHESLGRSLLDKLISFIVVAIIGIPGIATLMGDFTPGISSSLTFLLAAVVLVAAVLAAAWHMHWHRSGLAAPARKAAAQLQMTLDELVRTARRYPLRVFGNAALSMTSFVLLGASYWCMFRSLGVEALPPIQVVTIVAVCSLIAYVPVSFNGLGTADAAGVVLFGHLGISASFVVTAFICLRLFVVAIAWIPASVILAASNAMDTRIR